MENDGEKWRKMGKNRQGPPPVPTQNAFEVEMVRSEAGELQPVPTPAISLQEIDPKTADSTGRILMTSEINLNGNDLRVKIYDQLDDIC